MRNINLKLEKYKVETVEVGYSVIKDLNRVWIHEYSYMGAKKVPMAENRTYPGSEFTWRNVSRTNQEICQKEINKYVNQISEENV